MTITEFITAAKGSVLKTVAVKNDNDSIVSFMNLGLIELYKRFPLNIKEHIIDLVEGTETYTMPADYMWTIAAYGEVPENSLDTVLVLPINEEDNPLSINTASWNTVQVPTAVNGAHISIIYTAAPITLLSASLEDTIPLPPQMIEPLLLYVGYLGNEGPDGSTPTDKGASQYAKFEQSCLRIEVNGMLTSDDLDMSDRIASGGWK